MIAFQYNDGGAKAAGLGDEKNTCTVRALSNSLGISYHEAHVKVKRKRGGRCTWANWFSLLTSEGFVQISGLDLKRRVTLKKLLSWTEYKTGRYIFCVTGHTFAVVDGIVQDTWKQGAGRRVFAIYRAPVNVIVDSSK